MPRARLARLLVAITATALIVPTLAASASAAKPPPVPSLAKVAKIYPHVKDGAKSEYPMDSIDGPGKKCDTTKKVKGATGNGASYSPAETATATAKKPSLSVSAIRFASAKSATKYLKSTAAYTKKCGTGGGSGKKPKVSTFKVKLGNQSWGASVKSKVGDTKFVVNLVTVRKGKHLVGTFVTSADGKKPSVKKTIKLTKLALKAAS